MGFETKKPRRSHLAAPETTMKMLLENQRESDIVADACDGHFGESQRFSLGLLAAGSLNDHVQQVAAKLLQRFCPVDERRRIKVDVVLHLNEGQLIAGDLDDGDNGIAGGRTAATGKDHYLRAAGRHGCHGGGIVARRVHSP